jgi:Mn2+/Fe2+ NRAMP family transporter
MKTWLLIVVLVVIALIIFYVLPRISAKTDVTEQTPLPNSAMNLPQSYILPVGKLGTYPFPY